MELDQNTSPKKIKLVVSDFHLSRGKWLPDGRRNPLEDFFQDERFRELLDHYSMGTYATAHVELIINGDFFDPLAVIPVSKDGKPLKNLEYPLEVEEPAAVAKIRSIVRGHPVSIEALRIFLSRGKRVIFRWGNHDVAIIWPKVQEFIRETLAPPDQSQIEFQIKPYIFDRICVTHGHQYEALNQFDENNLFMTQKGGKKNVRLLNLPFGSFFVLGFLNQIKVTRSFITQVQPLRVYLKLALVLEPLFFFINGFQAAWFFIKMRFITHPMRFARFRKTLKLLGEVIHRPSLEEAAEDIFSTPEGEAFDTIIMGHNHQATVRIFPYGKQYINTGTWIPITSLDMSTLGHRVLRTYALIEYIDDKARASLKIWNGPPRITDDFT